MNFTGEEYWRWRNSITEMWLDEQKVKVAELTMKLMQKEAELHSVKAQIFFHTEVEKRRSALCATRTEYDKLKSVLESKIGESLNGKVIDDFTYEVRDPSSPDARTAVASGQGDEG